MYTVPKPYWFDLLLLATGLASICCVATGLGVELQIMTPERMSRKAARKHSFQNTHRGFIGDQSTREVRRYDSWCHAVHSDIRSELSC